MDTGTEFADSLVRERTKYHRLFLKNLAAVSVIAVAIVVLVFILYFNELYTRGLRHEEAFQSALHNATRSFATTSSIIPLLTVTVTIIVVIELQNRRTSGGDPRQEVATSVLSMSASLCGFLAAVASSLWLVESANHLFHGAFRSLGSCVFALLLAVASAGLSAFARSGLDVRAVAIDDSARRWKLMHGWSDVWSALIPRLDTIIAVCASVAALGLIIILLPCIVGEEVSSAATKWLLSVQIFHGIVGVVWFFAVGRICSPLPKKPDNLLTGRFHQIAPSMTIASIAVALAVYFFATAAFIVSRFYAAGSALLIAGGATALALLRVRGLWEMADVTGRLASNAAKCADEELAGLVDKIVKLKEGDPVVAAEVENRYREILECHPDYKKGA